MHYDVVNDDQTPNIVMNEKKPTYVKETCRCEKRHICEKRHYGVANDAQTRNRVKYEKKSTYVKKDLHM